MTVRVLFCPICNIEIHRDDDEQDFRPIEVVYDEVEEACRAHLSARHPLRFKLWQILGWDWILTGWEFDPDSRQALRS